jgi:hypothetical protein
MNTPNETPENTNDKPGKGKRHDRTQRASFWLRTIELQKDRKTREYRKSLRDTAREGISDEEYAAMLATLEKMARNLGWDESQPDERAFGRGHRRGFGHDGEFGHGFGHDHRHPAMLRGFRRMHPADHHGHDHDDRDHHGHDHDDRDRTPRREDVTAEAPQA